ncbi:MAG: molybdenum cofactor biosynthesis protein [Myxococcales bacterium]|nr:molybdenum cofactor biosynthesis protein [Myxococcales bacterium]
MSKLTHFDDAGHAHMVDVGTKSETERIALAAGAIEMEQATVDAIGAGIMGKGDVLAVARVAAIAGLKRTSELIPLCHPVRITGVDVTLEPRSDLTPPRIEIRATVKAFDRTGVEMEALMAVSLAALTVYDMCKSVDRGMRIVDIRLLEKRGGRSGTWTRST